MLFFFLHFSIPFLDAMKMEHRNEIFVLFLQNTLIVPNMKYKRHSYISHIINFTLYIPCKSNSTPISILAQKLLIALTFESIEV